MHCAFAYRRVAPKNLGAVSDTISMSHFQFRDLYQIKLKSLLAPHITCLLVDMGSPGGVLSSIWRAAGWASIKITAFVIGNHLPQNGVIQSRPCSVPLLASSPYDVVKFSNRLQHTSTNRRRHLGLQSGSDFYLATLHISRIVPDSTSPLGLWSS